MSTRRLVIAFALLALAIGILLAVRHHPDGRMVVIAAVVLLLMEASA